MHSSRSIGFGHAWDLPRFSSTPGSVRQRKPMRDRIAAAVRTGELPSGVEPDLAVAMLSGPLFYRRFITRQPVSPRVVDAIVTTVLAGLRA